MNRWVAFLRAVNVGGRSLAMSDLREIAVSLGWRDVRTYIQSGNLVFAADPDAGRDDRTDDDGADDDGAGLAGALSEALAERQGFEVPVIVRSSDELTRIASSHPDAGGAVDAKFLHVHLLGRRPDSAEGVDPDAFAPDTWTLDGREVYVTYPNGSGRSKLTIQVFERAWNVLATGRNLNTIRRLAELAAAAD